MFTMVAEGVIADVAEMEVLGAESELAMMVASLMEFMGTLGIDHVKCRRSSERD